MYCIITDIIADTGKDCFSLSQNTSCQLKLSSVLTKSGFSCKCKVKSESCMWSWKKNFPYGWYLVNVLVIVYVLLQILLREIGVVSVELCSVYSVSFDIKKHETIARIWSSGKSYICLKKTKIPETIDNAQITYTFICGVFLFFK